MSVAVAVTAAASTRAAGAPGAFKRLARITIATAVAAIAITVIDGGAGIPVDQPTFWVLAGFCLVGELLPIRLARATHHDEITISTAFAFAILLTFGLLPAMAVYAVASIVTDIKDPTSPRKALFNAAQYVLALGAASAVLTLLSDGLPGGYAPHQLPAVLLATATFFVVNHVLAGIAAAMLTGQPILSYVGSDLGFHAWAAGFQLALAPIVVVAAETQLLLVPLLFLPVLAIYFGGRHAVINVYRALHDELTGLPNRQLLCQRLDEALRATRAGDAPLAVMLVDLDDFKAVNDSLGHELGDALLAQIADRFRAVVPSDATLARLGGDEFAVVLPGLTLGDGRALGRRLLDQLEVPFEIESFSFDIGASIGVTEYSPEAATGKLLLKRADLALHRAKSAHTGVETYSEALEDGSFDRLALAAQLRRGIERGELVLHFQPKVALRDGGLCTEALVRWEHPQLGMIQPQGFIPLAEQTNLIKPLTHWVIGAALKQCREWRDRGLDVRVAVNVSTRSLLDRQLLDEIDAALTRWDVPPSALQVEITETKIIADFGRARSVLHALRRFGIRVAIDDFGTGYSSLAQLQQLPADEIKIDKRFVRNMEHDDNDAAIVRSTIGLGRNLSLDITAEGVESEEVCERLEQLGCDYVQGFHLGRPVPADACEREMRSIRARTNRFKRAATTVQEGSWSRLG